MGLVLIWMSIGTLGRSRVSAFYSSTAMESFLSILPFFHPLEDFCTDQSDQGQDLYDHVPCNQVLSSLPRLKFPRDEG